MKQVRPKGRGIFGQRSQSRNGQCGFSILFKTLFIFYAAKNLQLFPYATTQNHIIFGGSLYVSGKLPTYPSPKPTFSPKREVSVNVGLGEE